jgi:hypothetical protein
MIEVIFGAIVLIAACHCSLTYLNQATSPLHPPHPNHLLHR